jgi:SAM-dependent methyltransferase
MMSALARLRIWGITNMDAYNNRKMVMLPHVNWQRCAGDRPIYVFGSGGAGILLIEYLRAVDIEPAGVIDNNREKREPQIMGLEVSGPEKLNAGAYIIIASCHYREIAEQLNQLGFKKDLDYADNYDQWFEILSRYCFVNAAAAMDAMPGYLQNCYMKMNQRKIAVFGSGNFGKKLIQEIKKYGIVPELVFDNDEAKWQQTIEEIRIAAPSEIESDHYILVASTWGKEIKQQLVERGLTEDKDFLVVEIGMLQHGICCEKKTKQVSAVDILYENFPQAKEQQVHFFIHNSMHAGDIILTRPLITELREKFPHVRITLECPENRKYLWEDLNLAVMIYKGSEYREVKPTPNCPPEAVFVNMWFGVFPDILDTYGLSYANNVHTFNRFMNQYQLQHAFQLANKSHLPMIDFKERWIMPFSIREHGILVENGAVLSGQSNFGLNDCLHEIAEAFPNLNFYCAATPNSQAPNVVDCSTLNLIELSELSNRCVGFLTLGSGVNAATHTENNRYKPRCIAGWNYPWKVWYTSENPTFFAWNREDIKNFLLSLSKKQKGKSLARLQSTVVAAEYKEFCKFLRSRAEIERCTEYLKRNGLASHAVICKDWEIAHIISDLSDGNLLDMGSSDSYILKNAVIKGIKGEKFGIDLRAPNVPLAEVSYIEGNLLQVPLPGEYFQNITCLSVLEHDVDFGKFSGEAARLLKKGGTLYVTFDYWNPKIGTKTKLYGLAWDILDKGDVLRFIQECANQGLKLVEDIDWTVGDAVINENYCAPAKVSYTFGMLVFKKM